MHMNLKMMSPTHHLEEQKSPPSASEQRRLATGTHSEARRCATSAALQCDSTLDSWSPGQAWSRILASYSDEGYYPVQLDGSSWRQHTSAMLEMNREKLQKVEAVHH